MTSNIGALKVCGIADTTGLISRCWPSWSALQKDLRLLRRVEFCKRAFRSYDTLIFSVPSVE